MNVKCREAIENPDEEVGSRVGQEEMFYFPPLGRPKLFGGRLEEFFAFTGQLLPPVILTPTQILSRFAIRQHGMQIV